MLSSFVSTRRFFISFFFSSRRRHTRCLSDWSSDVCSSDLTGGAVVAELRLGRAAENKAAVLKALKEGQRPDGGYGKEGAKGSDLETTYRVLRAFHRSEERRVGKECRSQVPSETQKKNQTKL